MLLVVPLVLDVVDQPAQGEVLRPVGGWAADPWIGGPVADAADEGGHIAVDPERPGGLADLVRPAFWARRRPVHERSIGPRVSLSEYV
jgi:hypothetical protein